MGSDAASNTNIDVDVMPETSTDSPPNVPKYVNLDSNHFMHLPFSDTQ